MEATPEIRKRPAKLDNLRPPEEVSVPRSSQVISLPKLFLLIASILSWSSVTFKIALEIWETSGELSGKAYNDKKKKKIDRAD